MISTEKLNAVFKFTKIFIISYIVMEMIECIVTYYCNVDLHAMKYGFFMFMIIYGFKFHIFCCLFPFLFAAYKCKHKKCKHEHCI